MLKAVRDPIWKHIYLSESLFEATLEPCFMRLSRIKQLGPTHMVYPGATHTRASHSYGVYHAAQRLLSALLERGADRWVSSEGKASFLAAALFHDVGHFPYTHSLKELPLKSHETLTAEIVQSGTTACCIEKTGANPAQVAAIIDHRIQTSDTETRFFRSLLSGVLDPDKIDYLTRDAFFCGVPYGTQDIDFIISHLEADKEKGFSLHSHSLIAVESVLFAKYAMYRSVYWHKTVRVATAMMKKALYSALTEGAVSAEELYNQDDEGIYRLIEKRQFTAKEAALMVYERHFFSIAAEIPFDETNPYHLSLEVLKNRTEEEERLAQQFGICPQYILIDVPERISFESDIWIHDTKTSFSSSNTVFKGEQIRTFTQSLRIIRVALARDIVLTQRQREILAENYNIVYNKLYDTIIGGMHDYT